jgi:hypothetical protein
MPKRGGDDRVDLVATLLASILQRYPKTLARLADSEIEDDRLATIIKRAELIQHGNHRL